MSGLRARQGFTPVETATFVFSLKQPLYTRLHNELSDDPVSLAETSWALNLLLDALGLYTTEVFQRSREAIILRQKEELRAQRFVKFTRVILCFVLYPDKIRAPNLEALDMTPPIASCTAFDGVRRIASGTLTEVAAAVKRAYDRSGGATILVFDDATSRPVEFDLRGSVDDVLARLADHGAQAAPEARSGAGANADDTVDPQGEPARGRGRPKLGVVAREVTLLPRHWEWLNGQPGGASVALRKLVEAARLAGSDKERVRHAQEVAYRFMTAIGGNLPDYEEATRALYANDRPRFEQMTAGWPNDIRAHARKLAAAAFSEAT
jgi:uncharacterized protein